MTLETMGTSRRRDKVAIMVDLLDLVQEPRRLTHILYKSNMSYVQLLKYLENLKEMGFAEEKEVPFRSFKITENGKLFMELVSRNGNSDSDSKQ